MDVPTVSQVITASAAAPYYSLVVELDAAVITELVGEMGELPLQPDHPVRVGRTEAEVADAALRLLRLLDRPRSLAVLGRQLVRELHYWLLAGRHGGAIRVLGAADGHGRRIARAIDGGGGHALAVKACVGILPCRPQQGPGQFAGPGQAGPRGAFITGSGNLFHFFGQLHGDSACRQHSTIQA